MTTEEIVPMESHNLIRDAKNFRLAVAHEEMNPRKRNTMEDVHRIRQNLLGAVDDSYSYFGVYDGHGGRHIVNYLEEQLEKNVATELLLGDDATVQERLTRAFLITDMQSRQQQNNTAGATAVSVLLRREQGIEGASDLRRIYAANVGDSRAVLLTKNPEPGKAVDEEELPVHGFYGRRLTFDHRAEDEDEQRRIQQAGGFITRGRVLGILAVSRSFGDHGMKDFVTADPYLSETVINSDETGDCPILILACDGVWDVFSDQEAADYIMEMYIEKGSQPFEEAAKMLVDESIKRGSADNITAIVIFL